MRVWMPVRLTLAHAVGGGMERHADALASGLAERGHDITVTTTAHPQGIVEERDHGVRTLYLPGSTWRRYQRRWWAESYARLRDEHEHRPYDVIVSHSAGALGYLRPALAQLGIPGIVVLHGSLGHELSRTWRGARDPRGLYRLARAGWRLPALLVRWRRAAPVVVHWIAVSEAIAGQHRREVGVPEERVSVVPVPVDLSRFRPDAGGGDELRRRLGIPVSAPVVCFTARLEATKGIHVLVEALARLRPAHPRLRLVVAGGGPHEAAVRRLVRDLDLEDAVDLLGPVDHDGVAAVHAASDVFALPALGPEGLPLSLAEAMASGLPVVASAVSGVTEAVEDGATGILTPPGDADALAAAIGALFGDPPRERAMSRRAREAAEARFGAPAVVDAVERILAQAVQQAD